MLYELCDDVPLAKVTIKADPSHAEWTAVMNRMFADQSYRRGMGILIDRRCAPVPETKDVRAIMRFVDLKDGEGETRGWALVVKDLGSYGMARMAQELSENENTLGVFREVEEAVAWLAARSQEQVRPRRLATGARG